MPCNKCNTTIKHYTCYYNSNGLANTILCKTCGKCTLCHINDMSHLIKWDKNVFDIELDIEETSTPHLSNIFTENWR